jgi:hypothetical protein
VLFLTFPAELRMKPAKLYFPDHPGDIKYFIPSGVECRMFPDHPGRYRQSYGCTPVVPGRTPDVCRDVNETVALTFLCYIYQIGFT